MKEPGSIQGEEVLINQKSKAPANKESIIGELNQRLSGLESKLDSLYLDQSKRPSNDGAKKSTKYNKEIDQRSKSIGTKKKKKSKAK
jgi:hypothetical protein